MKHRHINRIFESRMKREVFLGEDSSATSNGCSG